MNLDETQKTLNIWLKHNFPETTPDHQLKGVMEELGELCHVDLKASQGIRGYTQENSQMPIMDAIGDITIYLMNYCNTKNILFKDCIAMAFQTIMKRDWQEDPVNGESTIEPLTCCICGKTTPGRQWQNTAKGQSICTTCYSWLQSTCDDSEVLQNSYGEEGYHHNLQEV